MNPWRKIPLILLLINGFHAASTSHAQTYLAAHGTGQVLSGNKTTAITLQEGVNYRVTGLSPGEGFYIATGAGTADLREPKDLRVLSGGVFASDASVTLKSVKASTRFWGDSSDIATYDAEMTASQAMGHVYAVLQWFVNDEPVAINVQRIGTVAANRPTDLSLSVLIQPSQKSGTYSLHVYSGYTELHQTGADAPSAPTNSAAGVNLTSTKFIGMRIPELTDLLGTPVDSAPDPIITGCTDLTFKARSIADYQEMMVTAEMMGGICLGISFIKYGGGDKGAFTNQEIGHWMMAYSQGTNAQWKQDGPKKWTLEAASDVPYSYRANWLLPTTFTVQTQELFDRASKVRQQTETRGAAIPGLPGSGVSPDDVIPGLPKPDSKIDTRIPGLPEASSSTNVDIPGLPPSSKSLRDDTSIPGLPKPVDARIPGLPSATPTIALTGISEPTPPSKVSNSASVKKDAQSTAVDYEKSSLEQLALLAEKGDAEAQHSLGSRYLHGQGVAKDVQKAFALMCDSSAKGSAIGTRKKGVFYENGWGTEKDYKVARECYEKALFDEDMMAADCLGEMYVSGNGVGVDYVLASKLFQLSANKGIGRAIYSLAVLYDEGKGVTQDYAKALTLYEQAATKGMTDAYVGLGYMYRYGHGVKIDQQQTVALWRKAAEKGNSYAMTLTAAAYMQGVETVPEDIEQALFWAQKAKQAGHPKADFLVEAATVLLKSKHGGDTENIRLYAQAQEALPPVTSFEGRMSQGVAIRTYPELGIKDSPLNTKFWSTYKAKRQTNPSFFDDEGWPIALAHETVALANRPK